MSYQPIETAPHDRPVLVYYDHDADTYQDPANPGRLTDYAANAEGWDYLDGRGVTIAHWADSHEENDGWEAANSYTIPACWLAWLNGDMTEYAVNALLWAEIPQPLASQIASGTPTRSAETTGSVGEADGGPAHEVGGAQ